MSSWVAFISTLNSFSGAGGFTAGPIIGGQGLTHVIVRARTPRPSELLGVRCPELAGGTDSL